MASLRILIVERHPMNGGLLAEALEDLGFTVCPLVTDVATAHAAAVRWRPDLIVIDVGLTEPAGVAVVDELLQSGVVPHVFVTGDNLSPLSFPPAAVLIQRPFRGADIQCALQQALGDVDAPRSFDC